MSLSKIKTIRSYVGLARWLAETTEKQEWLAYVQVEDIASPYAYSPTKQIRQWHGCDVVWFETAHKVYEIFAVPNELLRFKDEEKATDWHIRFSKKRA